MNPTDFNQFASGEEQYLQYYYVTRFNYYRNLYGYGYQVQSIRTGDSQFNPMRDGLSYGVRLRYNLSPSLGLSFGVPVPVLSRAKHSNVGMKVDVVDERVGRDYVDYIGIVSYQYQNSGFALSASAWVPQLAAHFGWQYGSVLRFEVFVAGGPLFAECRFVNERRMSVIDPSGFDAGTVVRTDMSGKATGILRGARRPHQRQDGRVPGFVRRSELRFSRRHVPQGPGYPNDRVRFQRPAGPCPQELERGMEHLPKTDISSTWGKFSNYQVQNQPVPQTYGGAGPRKFTLNLSGFQREGRDRGQALTGSGLLVRSARFR